jgi:CRP-like cAMP-binding protein
MPNQPYPSAPGGSATVALERALSSHQALDGAALAAVREGFAGSAELVHSAGAELTTEFRRSAARLVVRDWIARGAALADGRRQIVGLHLPGDVLAAPAASETDLAVWTLTEASTACVERFWREAETARAAGEGIGPAWTALRAAERSRLVHQIVRLGRLSALERTAHLLVELHERQVRVGLAPAGEIALPLTQDVLADILGLSVLHV